MEEEEEEEEEEYSYTANKEEIKTNTKAIQPSIKYKTHLSVAGNSKLQVIKRGKKHRLHRYR